MGYFILHAKTSGELAQQVTKAMQNGYNLAGGVTVDPKTGEFLQAVYK